MGNGTAYFDSMQHRYFIDLFVTALYDADASAHSDRWKKSFQAASKLLFEATNGQMQFGKISYLNNGPVVETDDIRLLSTGNKSSTDLGPNPFDGHSSFVPHVMNEPLVMLHECGHYVFLLYDEYLFSGVVLRKCQGDPATHECIMEYGKGVGLRLTDLGDEATSQPLHRVGQYCYTNHQPKIGNQQESVNQESCWHTIKGRYHQLAFPCGGSMINALQPIQWDVRSFESKFAIVVPSSVAYNDPDVARAIKSAIKHFATHITYSGDQLAVAIGQSELLRPMSRLTLKDLGPLFAQIDQTELGRPGDARQLIEKATQAFMGRPGAYQTMVLLTPAVSEIDFGEVNREVSQRSIVLKARTLGHELGGNIDEIDSKSKWFEHENVPALLPELDNYAFALQNELIQMLYSRSPGQGVVDMCLGRLSRSSELTVSSGLPQGMINLEQRDSGFDFPVWIESGASAVTFLLSEPLTGNIAFTLISPRGQEVSQAVASSALANNVVTYYLTELLPGRWILRLTRRNSNCDELPFFLLVASKNRHVSTQTQVVLLKSQRVKFRSQIKYEYALDRIQATVEIFRFLPDAEAPGKMVHSAVLRRHEAFDHNGRPTELSNGWYEGEIELEVGVYMAYFRWHNSGAAMYISNPNGIIQGEVMEYPEHQIPALSRVRIHRFEVRNHK